MKCSFLAIFATCSFACASSQNIPTSQEFNRKASEYFLEHFNEFDLSPLDEVEKCMLKKTVENDLNELNGSKIVILHDKFLIKHYFEDYLQLGFSFIEDSKSGKRYFLSLPQLDEFIFDVEANYVQKNDSVYQLEMPRQPVEINTRLLDDMFFSVEDFLVDQSGTRDFYSKSRFAGDLLREGFSFFHPYLEISLGDFVGRMQKDLSIGLLSHESFNKLMKLEERSLQNEISLNIFFIEHIGYYLQIYSRDKATSKLKLDLIMLPDRERSYSYRHAMIRYRDCKQYR